MKSNPLRNFSLLALFCLLVLIAVCVYPPRSQKVEAQYQGTFSQQLDVETLQFAWTNTPSVNAIHHNLGQAAHTIFIPVTTGGGAGCSIIFQGSGDGLNWTTLAALPHIASWTYPVTLFAFGTFNYYQIVANPHSQTCFTSGVFPIYYVGYQFGGPLIPGAENFASTPGAITLVFPTGTDGNPYQPIGGQCYNPNASTAYLQLFDSTAAPSLGTGYFYQIGIGAGLDVDFNFHNFAGNQLLYAGAATTAGGATAVSSALLCDFQINRRGPFGSFAGQ